MTRLLITRPLLAPVLEAARNLGVHVEVRSDTLPMTGQEIRQALRHFDIVLPTLGDMFSADVFADVPDPRCKLLANFGVGYNHIDVLAAASAGVVVTNTPGAVTDATADIAVMLILMSARRASEGERMVRAEAWPGWHPTQMLGQHVTGKHLGIVGMGRIGQAIAHRCHFGFGMTVSYVARSDKDLTYPAQRMKSVSELAAAVDFLVIAVPGGPQTRHLIDADVLSALPSHAHLVNISRGDVIDEAALVAALAANQFAGAGLDVYEFEPMVSQALLNMDNVTLLPHLGTATAEVRTGMGLMAVANIAAFLKAEPLPNPV